ncbi:hydrolase [Paenibacillus swuensis]|uniref:Hydrolase n=1 Tax=Paenibacillus swuensis TaxID=1178515 RepID=A0A172TM52_9BACL|nr:metal-dependent hydrolase [Paenibacillus swuensis]ANE47863.1 hydrolase [Paenibacillus swuensis]
MDTGSHLVFGASLAGLACLDPSVGGSDSMFHAVLIGTLIGSHAPDFDSIVRFKGPKAYIRHHRGITHSVPALFLWPLLLSLPLAAIFGVLSSWSHLYGWIFTAVCFHVFLDLFNAYGVQCFRPFTAKWFHLDTLSIFDPFLFTMHAGGLLVWILSDVNAGEMFKSLFGVTFVYILLRFIHQRWIVYKVREHFGNTGNCHVIPSLHWFYFQFMVETEQQFKTGYVRYGRIIHKDTYTKGEENPMIQASIHTDGVRAFLHFAQRVHVMCLEHRDGYKVVWSDMRFWHNHKLPFGAEVELDRNLNVISDTLGWNKKSWEAPYV